MSRDADVPSRVLAPDDLLGFRLDPLGLARVLAADLELEGGIVELDGDAAFLLGRRVLGPHSVLIFLSARAVASPSARLVDRARAATAAGLALWLVPPGYDPPIVGARAVALELAPSYRALLPAMVVALGLVDAVDAALVAPADARLFVDRAKRRVHLDGVAMARLSEIHFAYVEAVAAGRGAPVPKEELHARLSPNRMDDATVRQAKARTLEAMTHSFEEAGREAPPDLGQIFRIDRAGHRVTIAAYVR